MLINYKDENFEELTKEKTLVDFYANWCGPCRMLSPLVEKISDKIKVVKVNVDENEELSKKYKIMSIPCLILFKDGTEQKRSIGLIDETKLKEFIK